ncbi:nucleotide-sugar transporter [Microthyrium microscopicum]|uniref:Nucleotide-sugar transporter n=1 Tax=Microthyrium microscopicum TaxID=703497 RepID=A0A6A6UPR3_9PEZI|nr:nucleotide-sugar transporter [Microthyrium microscopicum]
MATENSKPTLLGMPLSLVSLATLAVQNAVLILVMHYSRIMPPVNGQRYFTSTAVFLNEVLKLIIALAIAFRDTSRNLQGAPFSTVCRTLQNQAFSSDSWKLAIPAALYTFQNSLQYIAVSNLDAATFQVTYQLKILTTAIFSVTMLRRKLAFKQWVALVLLMAGVAIVSVMPSMGGGGDSKKHPKRDGIHADHGAMSNSIGLFAVITACATSGLAGVYFEKVLKNSAKVTLWVRNVQLSFYSLFPALFIGVIFKDGRAIQQAGFFAGYNNVVWAAITCQAVGGLLVAMVVNYADNIAKNFATSISIILSFIASVWLFDFEITINFIVGMGFVLYATYLYSAPSRPPQTGEPQSEYKLPNSEDEKESDPALSQKS